MGGMIAHAVGVIEAFQRLGSKVIICSYAKIPNWKNKDVGYSLLKDTNIFIPFIKDLIRQRKAIKQIITILKKEKFDLIYVRWPLNLFFKKIHNSFPDIPIIMECSTPLEMDMAMKKCNIIIKKLAHMIDKNHLYSSAVVSAVSKETKEFLLKHHSTSYKEKIVVNPNGVDANRFKYVKNAIRKKHDIPPDSILVGFAGSMYPWQGVDILIKSFEKMVNKDIYLMIIGKDVDKEYQSMNKLKQLAKSTNPSKIIFTGAVSFSDMPSYFSACDILACPTVESFKGEFHGSPTKLFEYMAMGKGIVASSLAQIGEILEHNANALLIKPGDKQQLGEAILKLASDKKLREALGKNARKTVIEKYTWEENVKRAVDNVLQ